MEYNTQQRRLPLPEYGRSVQRMVDHALTITDREERQRCAHTIINIMGGMFPQLRDMPDFKNKLWDHLAIMSGFQLDIDYPVEIVSQDSLDRKPSRVPYPSGKIRYRHYGRLVQEALRVVSESKDEEAIKYAARMIASQMKRDYLSWNKDSVEDSRIADDLCELSDGRIRLAPEELRLTAQRQFPRRRQMAGQSKHRK